MMRWYTATPPPPPPYNHRYLCTIEVGTGIQRFVLLGLGQRRTGGWGWGGVLVGICVCMCVSVSVVGCLLNCACVSCFMCI